MTRSSDIVPSREEAEKLLAYLPRFEKPGRTFFADEGSEPSAPSSFPYPVYADDVFAFFLELGLPPWADYEYRSRGVEDLLDDPSGLATASWVQVRAVLTYCSRGERFCGGFWSHVLNGGVVQAALRRLDELTRGFD